MGEYIPVLYAKCIKWSINRCVIWNYTNFDWIVFLYHRPDWCRDGGWLRDSPLAALSSSHKSHSYTKGDVTLCVSGWQELMKVTIFTDTVRFIGSEFKAPLLSTGECRNLPLMALLRATATHFVILFMGLNISLMVRLANVKAISLLVAVLILTDCFL